MSNIKLESIQVGVFTVWDISELYKISNNSLYNDGRLKIGNLIFDGKNTYEVLNLRGTMKKVDLLKKVNGVIRFKY